MTDLEARVDLLAIELRLVAELVRQDAVAEGFLAGSHEIREGDSFLRYGERSSPTHLGCISSEGKWTYDGCEWHDRDQQRHHRRLYTIEEVAAIVSKAVADAKVAP